MGGQLSRLKVWVTSTPPPPIWVDENEHTNKCRSGTLPFVATPMDTAADFLAPCEGGSSPTVLTVEVVGNGPYKEEGEDGEE